MNKTEKPITHKKENIERREGVEFLEKIKKQFVDYFPFLNDEDRDRFIDALDKTIEDDTESKDGGHEDTIDIDTLIKKIKQLLVSLDNSHVDLIEKGVKKFKLDKNIYYKAGTFWLDVEGEPCEILSIDERPVSSLIEEKKKEIGGGTDEWKTYKATNTLMSSRVELETVIRVKNKNREEIDVDAKFIENTAESGKNKMENGEIVDLTKEDFVIGKMLNKDIAYIAINSWANGINFDGKNIAELVEVEMERFKNSKAIIFDVRENDGGNSHLAHLIAGHFLQERTQCCYFLVKKPENKDLIREDGYVRPNGEYYNQRAVILTGTKCISSTDMFLTFLKDTGRVITIGQTTGGGSGNPQSIELKLGNREFNLRVSCWRNYRNNGMEIENNGIEPDIFVKPIPDDVRGHIDRELKVAIAHIISIGDY